MRKQFRRIGRDLFNAHLVTSHGGNLSVRLGDRLLITRRGAMLAHLGEGDVVETGVWQDDWGVALASSELVVHRAIYQATSALAVVHAHPPHAVVLSLDRDEIVPLDSEGSYLLHRVPVVAAAETIGSAEVAALVAPALRQYKVVMLRGHGCFAVGQFLEEAYQWVSSLEASAQIIYLAERSGGSRKEYRRHSEQYGEW